MVMAAAVAAVQPPADSIAAPPIDEMAIRANTERTFERIEDLPRGDLLLLYQSSALALVQANDLTVIEKSRRVGLTWALAANAVLTAAAARGEGGDDVLYISYSQEMTREFIEACAMWSRAFMNVTAATGEFLFDDQTGDGEACRAIFGWGVTMAKKMLVRGAVPRTGGRARLALVIDDERVYAADAGLPPAPPPPPDPPAPEDLDISYIVEVSGGGSHWVTSYTVTSLGAGVRHIEWVHNGVDMGRAPNLTGWTKATTTAPIHGGEARGVGRYGAGDWVDWLYLPEGGGEL